MKHYCLRALSSALLLLLLSSLLAKALSTPALPNHYEGTIWYVGGSGPGNYTSIQAAINDASDGDTIYVYAGVYTELITVTKTLTIQGENKDTTVVNGNHSNGIMVIAAENVRLTTMTLTNSSWRTAGIFLYASHCTLTNLIILDCYESICLENAHENVIDNILITSNQMIVKHGITLLYSNQNRIVNTTVMNTRCSMKLEESSDNEITNNLFIHNEYGIWLEAAHHTTLQGNTITQCEYFCLNVHNSDHTGIQNNDIYDNDNIAIWLEHTKNPSLRITISSTIMLVSTSTCRH